MVSMKRSCPYCGRIHDYAYQCPMKPRTSEGRRDKQIAAFRGSKAWKAKRKDIMHRDKGFCVVCRMGLDGEPDLVPADSVHHITPLSDDFEQRLDDNNLISLCAYHHERAERGDIDAEILLDSVSDINT